MPHRRIKYVGATAACVFALTLVWWVWTAGPVVVYRVIVYNLSGIDDHRIFPQRKLSASPLPFRFPENIRPALASEPIKIGGEKDISLSELLEQTETTAFLILKDDTLRFEKYLQGYGRSKPSLAFSMAKSVLSLLVGCALDDGYIRSVDQPVTDYVPKLAENGFQVVRLRHLLQMTSGIDYIENDLPFGIHPRFYYTNRLEQEVLNLGMKAPPGREFVYRSSDAYLLALVLKRALRGQSITEYTQTRIWNPLGMAYDGSWSVDHEPDGLEKTACCLSATAQDFAKFGRLYLDKGRWNGRQIVSENWVTTSTRIDTSEGSAWKYQYMWWLVSKSRPDFMAIGHLGQFIYVNPVARVVIVRLGKSPGGLSREEWQTVFMTLSDALR